MRYTINQGIEKSKSKVKRFIAAGAATMMVVGASVGIMAAPAFAASNGYCGSSANGCTNAAAAGAQCGTGASSGSFGAFGPGNNFAGGADGTQTGLNNSAVCGNRPGN
jgi:hypothetical protein